MKRSSRSQVSEDTVVEIDPSGLLSPVPEHLSLSHRVQLLKKQLKQQEQKSQAASAQVNTHTEIFRLMLLLL